VRSIVVGIDDSAGARAALSWALDEAKRQQAAITLVHAYLVEVAWIDRSDMARWVTLARDAAETALAHIIADADIPPGVKVHARVVEGNPVNVLIDDSHHADLLVVGTRGRGGLKGLLLGSVSQRCVERAHCPVVVIPPSD
jgi:nucleotide-binding universal stress UspA family protein